ncbi:DUF445 family protein [Carboxydochorda subterranea]|uniref:DUF445 family protein n=1 Tax=Carboxydichorda subterranea TaxID=3109565 RepID=A0ABZ1C0T9_9FIRM|nr:DUF445 family protein [Limnochorda sp. L945t]WRP18714.1 DUF445 family protein [Limnochorda sp. L945t]
MVTLRLLTVPLVAAGIGWITNVAAVRLLFWPIRPIRIWGTRWYLQGIFPRRQHEIARGIGELVERELLRPEDLVAGIDGARYREEAVWVLEGYVARRMQTQLPRFLPASVRDAMVAYAVRVTRQEAGRAMEAITDRLKERLQEQLRVSSLLGEKLEQLDLVDFEGIILRLIGRELRWIEVLGAVMGFLVGVVQMLLLWP